MLSYRHAFHAGNFADVLKHLVQVRILRYLLQKEKPLLYLDTHAGAGDYKLGATPSGKAAEFESGIGRLWSRDDLPEIVADYVALVRRFNHSKKLTHYPGSPWLAQQLLRPVDRMVLHELHPADLAQLQETFRGDRRCRVRAEDGFAACLALLPPAERRGLVLLDPPYELKEDYQRVVDTLTGAYQRFATGTYALWYPVVERRRIDRLEKALSASGIRRILLLELGIAADRPGHGMTASGMVVINPPFSLATEMAPALDYLAQTLGVGHGHSRIVELVGE
ncbi:MAG: 23S rRNA (adenine(2030)-N(6))-methyltransferase RlmJ [Gammaproteobacteria bacterium]|nr:23S rRNA (adenine(2030)-N(6))-methyltransferase RlmJ [Gammaproteobacteria bacterium]